MRYKIAIYNYATVSLFQQTWNMSGDNDILFPEYGTQSLRLALASHPPC